MANVFDVALFLRNQYVELSHKKLQKLLYYTQAWSLAWEDKPLFNSVIEAWDYGPVIPEVYNAIAEQETVPLDIQNGNVSNLSEGEINVIEDVLILYGDKDADWLVEQTHREDPWRTAYKDGTHNVITEQSLKDYYKNFS